MHPEYYPFLDIGRHPGLRRCVFRKLTVIVFQETDLEVEVILIADARSNWLESLIYE
jgi:hypothetical protein